MPPPPHSAQVEVLLESREKLRRLARALVGEAWAEDVAQEACLRALQRPPLHAGALGGWLVSVARHAALRRRAREAARLEVERRAARPEALDERSEREERELELQSELLRAVQALAQPYRTALYMRYWQGLSPRRIARELGIPEATVKTRLRRGLAHLRADLEPKGSHGALLGLAFPTTPLFPGAPAGFDAAAALKGLALMQKPLAAVGLAAIATVLSVVWIANRQPAPEAVAPGIQASPLSADGAAATPASALDAPDASDARPASPTDQRRAAAEPQLPARAQGLRAGLAGRVLGEDGRPVEGAEVRAHHELDPFAFGFEAGAPPSRTSSAATGPDGRFLVEALEEGPVQLVVEAPLFAPFRKDATAYPDLRTELGDLVLARGVRLAGRVVDAAGTPVPGAEIRGPLTTQSANVLRGGGEEVLARTDAAGQFVVDRHAVGPWSLVAQGEGHPAGHASGATERAGERVEGIEIVLPRGAEIRGRLSGMPPGAATSTWVRAGRADGEGSIAGGFVVQTGAILGERSARVDAAGEFVLRGLDPGARYRLGAYDSREVWGGRQRSRPVEAEAGAGPVELAWLAPAALALRVVDGRTGEPVERFSASSDELFAPRTLREHADGRARLDDLPLREQEDSGRVPLTVSAPGYRTYQREGIVVTRGLTLDLGEVALEPLPRVRVSVRDEAGLPVEGAWVSLDEPEARGERAGSGMRMGLAGPGGAAFPLGLPRGLRTDGEGRAVLGAEPGARVRLSVRAKGWAPWEAAVLEMPVQGDLTVDVRLERGARVEVLVTDGTGLPAAGVRVEHQALAEPGAARAPRRLEFPAARFTDSEGRAWFRHLGAGAHGFRIDPSGGGDTVVAGGGGARIAFRTRFAEEPDARWTRLVLVAGEEATLALSTGARTFLEGSVTEHGRPLAGATLRLLADPDDPRASLGGGPEASADARGAYRFEDLEPGEYVLLVEHDSRALPYRASVRVRPAGDRLDLDLDVTLARGVVRGEGGRPLAGARVRAERVAEAGRRQARTVMMSVTSSGAGSTMVVRGPNVGAEVETDAEGRFELRGLPADVGLRLVASAPGASPARGETFRLAPDEERAGFTLELLPGGVIEVSVHDAGGEPAAAVLVMAQPSAGGESPAVQLSDEQGAARFADLAPGTYTVSARLLGREGPPLQQEVQLIPGEPLRLRFDLP